MRREIEGRHIVASCVDYEEKATFAREGALRRESHAHSTPARIEPAGSRQRAIGCAREGDELIVIGGIGFCENGARPLFHEVAREGLTRRGAFTLGLDGLRATGDKYERR
jgi:hypothetical protein